MSKEARDPMTVVQELNDASNANDLERVLRLFADDGSIRQIPSPPPPAPADANGKQEIRQWFEPQMQHLHIASRNLRASGDSVSWDATVSGEMFRQMGIDAFDVSAEATVRDGLITSFVITQTPEAVSMFQAVQRGGEQTGASA